MPSEAPPPNAATTTSPKTMSALTIPGSPTAALEMATVDPGTAAFGIGSTGAAILFGFMWMRRKWPRDTNEILKDRTEGALMDKIMVERNAAWERANEAISHRVTDAALIAGLQERNKYLQEECARLNVVIQKMETEFGILKDAIRKIQKESHKPIGPGSSTEPPTLY